MSNSSKNFFFVNLSALLITIISAWFNGLLDLWHVLYAEKMILFFLAIIAEIGTSSFFFAFKANFFNSSIIFLFTNKIL